MKNLIGFGLVALGILIIIGLPLVIAIYFDNGWLLFTYLVSWIPGGVVIGIAQVILSV